MAFTVLEVSTLVQLLTQIRLLVIHRKASDLLTVLIHSSALSVSIISHVLPAPAPEHVCLHTHTCLHAYVCIRGTPLSPLQLLLLLPTIGCGLTLSLLVGKMC